MIVSSWVTTGQDKERVLLVAMKKAIAILLSIFISVSLNIFDTSSNETIQDCTHCGKQIFWTSDHDYLEGSVRCIGYNQYTFMDGLWVLTSYDTFRCWYLPSYSTPDMFRDECLENNTVSCDKEYLRENWLETSRLADIWWQLTEGERWNISDFIIKNWLFYVIRESGTGDPFCGDRETIKMKDAVCLQNSLLRYLLMGETRDNYYNYGTQFGRGSMIYYKDNNGELQCGHPGKSWNLPVYHVSVYNASYGHAINVFLLESDRDNWNSWRFFQYTNSDIKLGNWQMPYGTTVSITLLATITPSSTCANICQYKWNITDTGSVVFTGFDCEKRFYHSICELGDTMEYNDRIYTCIKQWPWDNVWSLPPLPEPPYRRGDINKDGYINIIDILLICKFWGETGSPGWIEHDLNIDGSIDILDVSVVWKKWKG